MAKMFYTVEEAAQRLGVSEEDVKQMASEGKLQQFRDREKLMFKREQVDQLAGGDDPAGGSAIPVADSDADEINLQPMDDTGQQQPADNQGSTGVNVLDTGEFDSTDPEAQTQTPAQPAAFDQGDEEEISLEASSTGSGLMDLTQESDDTSLGGAELMDEIYAEGEGSQPGAELGESAQFGSSVAETGATEAGGLGDLDQPAAPVEEDMPGMTAPVASAEAYDPEASGWTGGALLVALIALVLGLIVALGAATGASTPVTQMMTQSPVHLWGWVGGLAVAAVVFSVVGWIVGKASA